MEYKVLTKEDRRRSGKFSPENLEHTLNSFAAEGWRVVSSVPVASMVDHQHLADHDPPRTRDSGYLTDPILTGRHAVTTGATLTVQLA
jgi:hypothetical protein